MMCMEVKILCVGGGWGLDRTLFSLSEPFVEYTTGTFLFPTFSSWSPSIQRYQILIYIQVKSVNILPESSSSGYQSICHMFWNWFPLLETGWYSLKYTEINSLIFWSLSDMLANPMIFPAMISPVASDHQGWNSNDVSSHLEVSKRVSIS